MAGSHVVQDRQLVVVGFGVGSCSKFGEGQLAA